MKSNAASYFFILLWVLENAPKCYYDTLSFVLPDITPTQNNIPTILIYADIMDRVWNLMPYLLEVAVSGENTLLTAYLICFFLGDFLCAQPSLGLLSVV